MGLLRGACGAPQSLAAAVSCRFRDVGRGQRAAATREDFPRGPLSRIEAGSGARAACIRFLKQRTTGSGSGFTAVRDLLGRCERAQPSLAARRLSRSGATAASRAQISSSIRDSIPCWRRNTVMRVLVDRSNVPAGRHQNSSDGPAISVCWQSIRSFGPCGKMRTACAAYLSQCLAACKPPGVRRGTAVGGHPRRGHRRVAGAADSPLRIGKLRERVRRCAKTYDKGERSTIEFRTKVSRWRSGSRRVPSASRRDCARDRRIDARARRHDYFALDSRTAKISLP